MRDPLQSFEKLDELRLLNPRHSEFPGHCRKCGAFFSVFRLLSTDHGRVLSAAVVIHREFSPGCSPEDIEIGDAIPFGPPSGRPPEVYANDCSAKDR